MMRLTAYKFNLYLICSLSSLNLNSSFESSDSSIYTQQVDILTVYLQVREQWED